jgi:hypothetical protein
VSGFGNNGMSAQQQQLILMQQQHAAQEMSLGVKFESLRKKKATLEKNLQIHVAGEGDSDKGKSSSFGSGRSSEAGAGGGMIPYRHAPSHTATRMTNRSVLSRKSDGMLDGVGGRRPVSAGVIGTLGSGDRGTLLSPDALLGRKAKKLVIDMHSPMVDVTSDLPAVDTAPPLPAPGGMDSTSAPRPPAATTTASKTQTNKLFVASSSESGIPITPVSGSLGGKALSSQDASTDSVLHPSAQRAVPSPRAVAGNPAGHYAEEEGSPPVLTKMGYFTSPDLSVLHSMSPDELASIFRFTVFRPHIGSIEWEGNTDIRDLNLDDIVEIEPKMVAVYDDDDRKPPVGRGLNKPAIVTLCDIFPSENASADKKLRFEERLRKDCQKRGAEFLDYSPATGEWTFRTLHFSRYGLDDSDEDEDGEEAPRPAPAPTGPGIKGRESPKKAAAAPPKNVRFGGNMGFAPSPAASMGARPGDHEDEDDMDNGEVSFARPPAMYPVARHSDPLELDRIRRSMTSASARYGNDIDSSYGGRSQYQASEWSSSLVQPYPEEGVDHYQDDREEDLYDAPTDLLLEYLPHKTAEEVEKALATRPPQSFVFAGSEAVARKWRQEESPCLNILKEVKARQFASRGLNVSQEDIDCVTSVRSAVGRHAGPGDKRPVDAMLFMGRSFRVGWSSSGKIVHAGNIVFASQQTGADGSSARAAVHVEQVDCTPWSKDFFPDNVPSYRTVAKLFTAVFECSEQQSTDVVDEDGAVTLPQDMFAPLWRLPRADMSRMDEYLQFVNLLKKLSECYPDEARDDSSSVMDNDEDDSPLPRHHPCWVIAKIISFFDAACGQEDSFIERFRTGREVLGSSACSMMPLCEDVDTEADVNENDRYVTLWERRREAMSQWLQRISKDPNGAVNALQV